MSLQRRKLGRSPLPLALTQTDSGRKLEKLSSVDPKVSHCQVEVSLRILGSVACYKGPSDIAIYNRST